MVGFDLICFLVGFGLSALALLAASAHLHLPHLHVHHGIQMPQAGGAGARLSRFNFGTIAAFLGWFGGTGYWLHRYSGVWLLVTLGIAILSGLAAASVIFWFLARVLRAREAALDTADHDMVGVLGRLSIRIRQGGTES